MWAFDETVERVVEKLTPALRARRPLARAEVHQPRHGGVPRPRPDDRGLHAPPRPAAAAGPRGRHRAADVPARRPRRDAGADRVGDRRASTRAGRRSRCASSRARTSRWSASTPPCTSWPLATYDTKQDSDTNYKRVLAWALTPERTRAVRIGVAGHNLFDIAYAHLLAEARGVERPGRVRDAARHGRRARPSSSRRDVGGLLLYTPVVHPREFDVAISYLIRRLEENASSENFMSAVFELASNEAMFEREKGRFLASLADARRRGARSAPRAEPARRRAGAPAARGRQRLRQRARHRPRHGRQPRVGPRDPRAARPTRVLGVDTIERRTGDRRRRARRRSSPARSRRSPPGRHDGGAGRAAVLRAAAVALAARRAELIEVMASETGKTIAEGDVEVSEAIDFANYYADARRGARRRRRRRLRAASA